MASITYTVQVSKYSISVSHRHCVLGVPNFSRETTSLLGGISPNSTKDTFNLIRRLQEDTQHWALMLEVNVLPPRDVNIFN